MSFHEVFESSEEKKPETVYEEPLSRANACTYLYFCTLGGLSNPKCGKRLLRNGTDFYYTYHVRRW